MATTTDSLDGARSALLFEACRFRRVLDLAGGELATPEDDAMLHESLSLFVDAVDDYERTADRQLRNVLGPNGVAAQRWGQS